MDERRWTSARQKAARLGRGTKKIKQKQKHKVMLNANFVSQKYSLSGAFERDFDREVKIERTRGWACTMQAQA